MKVKADILTAVFCSFLTLKLSFSQELLQSLQGTIGAENYTYYRLSRPGRLHVELVSLSGDADLYVSTETLNPSYNDYTAQSISCGKDVLEIPASYNRPIGISVFGHPNYEVSKYVISIYLLVKNDDMNYEQLTHLYHNYEAADFLFKNYEASDYMYIDAKQRLNSHSSKPSDTQDQHDDSLDDDEESAGSILWQILITLLKVVFEVIV